MEWVDNALSTRRGMLLLGGGAALLAAIILIVYLKNYRSNINSANATVSVLVAKNLIQKAAPAIQGHLDKAESIQKNLK